MTNRILSALSKRFIVLFLCVLLTVPVGLASVFSGESETDVEQEIYTVEDQAGEDEPEQLDDEQEVQAEVDGDSGVDQSEQSMDEQEFQTMLDSGFGSSRSYYVSNNGDDNADGLTPQTAWASLDKLNDTVFNPGDRIYLDATSAWDGQLTLKGSGEEGNPIVLTKYNDGGDPARRPLINGNGTTSYERRWGLGIGPDNITSGTVELVNVSFWEISGLEITNLGEQLAQRRCGIRILSDYASGPDSRTMENYIENKMEHIYISDCYVHDVNSAHQAQQAPGYDGVGIAGAKGGGGIISSGFVDDLLVEGCTVMRCDPEGIRNEACGPNVGSYNGVSANNGYPRAAQVTFRNNFVSQCAGDAFVMSGAKGGVMEYNYATQCGKSYLTDRAGSLLPNHGGDAVPQRLGTQNYGALWFVGCANSVAQYNAAVNNSYESAAGGTAWGIDAYCDNVLFQYNYSLGNPGGWYTHKYASTNTAVRYNISVDDGMSPGFNKAWDSFILLDPLGSRDETDAPKIYNNLIVLNLKEDTTFFGRNDDNAHVYFQNNIVYSKNRDNMKLLGGQNHTTQSIAGGDITNNLFYPTGLFDLSSDSVVASEVNVSDNLFGDPLLADIGAMPLDVLRNADGSAIDSTGARNMIFDVKALADFGLELDSPAIGAGSPVAVSDVANQWWPLTKDIFGRTINYDNTLNIGVQQAFPVLPESVTITGIPDNNMIIGATHQLGAVVLPENADDQSVTWTVTDEYGNDTNLASINQEGLLTIYGSGRIKIRVVTNADAACEAWAVVEIRYERQPILTESVTIMGIPDDNVIKGQSRQLSAVVLPENADNKSVTWTVTDEYGNPTSLAGINKDNGLLTITGSGMIKIRVVTNDAAACEDSVVIEVVYLYIDTPPAQPLQISLRVGQTYKIALDTAIPSHELEYVCTPPGFLTVDPTTHVIRCTKANGTVLLVIRSANYPDVAPLTVVITTRS